MKKIALLLALVMVLGVASMASAAEVKTSGEVSYTLKYADSGGKNVLDFDGLGMKLKVAATVSDQVSAAIRLRPLGFKGVTDAAGADLGLVNGVKVDQVYATISKFGLPVSVTLGLNSVFNDPFSSDGFGYVGGKVDMINIKTDSFSGFSAQVLSTADAQTENNLKAGYLNYDAEFGSFGLVVKPVKVGTESKFDFAVNGKAPIPSTPLTAMAEYISYADSSQKADYMAGVSATVADVDLYANYFAQTNAATSRITAGVSKEINGATYSLDLENADNKTSFSVGVTVAF